MPLVTNAFSPCPTGPTGPPGPPGPGYIVSRPRVYDYVCAAAYAFKEWIPMVDMLLQALASPFFSSSKTHASYRP